MMFRRMLSVVPRTFRVLPRVSSGVPMPMPMPVLARRLHTTTIIRNEEDNEVQVARLPLPESSSNLVTAIDNELNSLDSTATEGMSEYLKEEKWQINIDWNSLASNKSKPIELTKTVDGHKVVVSFSHEGEEQDNDEYNEDQAENGEHEHQHEDANGEDAENTSYRSYNMTALIRNPQGKTMAIECQSNGQELLIDNFILNALEKDAELHEPNEEGEWGVNHSYVLFEDLDASSQQAAIEWMESLSLNDDLAMFVSDQAQIIRTDIMKRQLGEIKKFLQ